VQVRVGIEHREGHGKYILVDVALPPVGRSPASRVGGVGGVRVQRVLSADREESWTVIGRDRRPVPAIESYLAWLTRIERSPNTVRAYAGDLATYWRFLEARGTRWDEPSLELLGEFTAWLRQPADNVVVLATGTAARSTRTVNRMLTAVVGLYEFQARKRCGVRARAGRRAPLGAGIVQAVLVGVGAGDVAPV
jgi:hypothetical protein